MRPRHLRDLAGLNVFLTGAANRMIPDVGRVTRVDTELVILRVQPESPSQGGGR